METGISYHIFPLGDAAITVDFGNRISESVNNRVLQLFDQLRKEPPSCMIDVIPAYSSLTICFDPFLPCQMDGRAVPTFAYLQHWLKEWLANPAPEYLPASRQIRIPVCYDPVMAPDIESIAKEKGIGVDELVQLHASITYRVYMLGFLPGFTYMGEVDERLAMPRKKVPVTVEAGGIGITGRQTGIYPVTSPGGWHIIGRTPLRLFEPQREEPALLRTGDQVQFYSISRNEFKNL